MIIFITDRTQNLTTTTTTRSRSGKKKCHCFRRVGTVEAQVCDARQRYSTGVIIHRAYSRRSGPTRRRVIYSSERISRFCCAKKAVFFPSVVKARRTELERAREKNRHVEKERKESRCPRYIGARTTHGYGAKELLLFTPHSSANWQRRRLCTRSNALARSRSIFQQHTRASGKECEGDTSDGRVPRTNHHLIGRDRRGRSCHYG